MVVLLTFLVVLGAFAVAILSEKGREGEKNELKTNSETMTKEELIAAYKECESNWNKYNEQWAKKVAWKRDAQTEYTKRQHEEAKMNILKNEISKRFPEVTKQWQEEANKKYEQMKKDGTLYQALTTQLHENKKDASVIKRGIAGQVIAGPAGAVVGALSAVDKNNRNQQPSTTDEKDASVIKRGIAGQVIAGPTGAIVGALSAVDKNNRNRA